MNTISLVVFDLSRTTVEDGTAVQDCLYEAARSFELPVTREEVTALLGMNKIHLFQYFLERSRGREVNIEDMEKFLDAVQTGLELAQSESSIRVAVVP